MTYFWLFHDSCNFHLVLYHIQKWFVCTSQEVDILKFLELHILQSKYFIILDQTSHIKKTIIGVFFSNPNDLIGSCDTPLYTNTSYESKFVEALPIPIQ